MKSLLKNCDGEQLAQVLNARELDELLHDWLIWARDDQLPPFWRGEIPWQTWLILGGRGAGKTRTGAEWVRAMAMGKSPYTSEPARRIALVGETLGDVRRVMVEGNSGLMAIHPEHERPLYEPSKRLLTWPNGSIAELFTAEDPEGLRGPQFMAAWCDELCKWQRDQESWDMLQFGLRLGDNPRQIVTTTPRPTALIKRLLAAPATIASKMITASNKAHLSQFFLAQIYKRYDGTFLGRQELDGELVEGRKESLWDYGQLEKLRLEGPPSDLTRIVVAIDPPVSSHGKSDSCGIIAAGLGQDGKAYILKDFTCSGLTPLGWARRAVGLYHDLEADRLVAEVNQGGDLVETVLRQIDPELPVVKVYARRGKWLRAEPVAALYEQARVYHCGRFAALEEQMCNFTINGLPGARSPDRLDALVWALHDLMLGDHSKPRMRRL